MAVVKRHQVVTQAVEVVVAVTKKSSALLALTTAALALPLVSLATEEENATMQYGHYEEGRRHLFGQTSRFKPIQADSLQNNMNLNLSDRIRFSFDYLQDTWSGATPITTEPLAFEGNRQSGTISGATPFLQNNNVYFDKHFNPLQRNLDTGEFFKNTQLVHTLSSASPETRKQGSFRLGYDWDEAALNIGGGLSVENDYESRFGSVGGTIDFNQKLTTLNVDLSYTNSDTSARLDHDAAPYIEKSSHKGRVTSFSDGTKLLEGTRQDWASSIGLTQVLNKNALLSGVVSYTRSTGYMANPYKTMAIAFIDPTQTAGDYGEFKGSVRAFLEQRPEVRNQWSENVRYVQYIAPFDAALHLDYRFFHDDWGINAHTASADWVQPLGDGWTITPRVRYYSQDSADFYSPYLISNQAVNKVTFDENNMPVVQSYNSALLPKNYSSDYRLAGYGALSGGITVSKKFAKGVTLEAGAEYYTHATDLQLGGGIKDGGYTDFDAYMVNASLKVDFSALSLPNQHSGHTGHTHHQHHAAVPAGIMFDHVLPQAGDVMIGYRYMYSNQTGDTLHGSMEINDSAIINGACGENPCYVTPQSMAMHMHMVDIMYAPTDWLTLMLMPQFMDMHMFMRPLNGAPQAPSAITSPLGAAITHSAHEHTTGGVGDTGMYALFNVWKNSHHEINLSLGATAPTGDSAIILRDTHRQQLGFIHYGMQLGSGTWDFKPSATYKGQFDDFSWGTQVSGTVHLTSRNDSGFSFGDIFQATSWTGYQILPWLSGSVRGIYTVQGTLKGEYNGAYNQIGAMDYRQNYGGRFWDVGFGVNAKIPEGSLQGNSLGVEWLQPVGDDVNGYQLSRDGALSATWSYMF